MRGFSAAPTRCLARTLRCQPVLAHTMLSLTACCEWLLILFLYGESLDEHDLLFWRVIFYDDGLPGTIFH